MQQELEILEPFGPPKSEYMKGWLFESFIRNVYRDIMKYISTPEGKAHFESWRKEKAIREMQEKIKKPQAG